MIIAPASSRPLSLALSNVESGWPGRELIVNVKSRGQWAAFGTHRDMGTRMIAPGLFEFNGLPGQWARYNADSDVAPRRMESLGDALLPVPGPDPGHGMMIIDYDARQALSIRFGAPAFVFNVDVWHARAGGDHWDEMETNLGLLLLAGHIRQAGIPGLPLVDLPAPPRQMAGPRHWIAEAISPVLDIPVATILADRDLRLPLAVPGWKFFEVTPNSPQAAAWLLEVAPNLHPQELRAWEMWSDLNGLPTLAAVACSARVAGELDGTLSPAPDQAGSLAPSRVRM